MQELIFFNGHIQVNCKNGHRLTWAFDLEGLQILSENSKYSVPNLCEIDAKLTVQQ